MADRGGRVLVTGAVGQIGSELTMALRKKYDEKDVVALGHITEPSQTLRESGPYTTCDIRNASELARIVDRYEIETIYHMAAISSAAGEENPQLAWDVNVNGLFNILEIARERRLSQVFVPSSLSVFGPHVSRGLAPQDAALQPVTMDGVTKAIGEAVGRYYRYRFGLDVRGLRYPEVISHQTASNGRMTDYAVEIFYAADACGHYQCFVREDTVLPMMYMPDCIQATIHLMEAPAESLSCPTGYNVGGMSFSAGELADAIRQVLPGFVCSFVPDERQSIADRCPQHLDDRAARRDWNWKPDYDLDAMVIDMVWRLWGGAEEWNAAGCGLCPEAASRSGITGNAA